MNDEMEVKAHSFGDGKHVIMDIHNVPEPAKEFEFPGMLVVVLERAKAEKLIGELIEALK